MGQMKNIALEIEEMMEWCKDAMHDSNNPHRLGYEYLATYWQEPDFFYLITDPEQANGDIDKAWELLHETAKNIHKYLQLAHEKANEE